MTAPTTFRSLIELWPSRESMASDIGATPSQVSKWWQRRTIPSEWWVAILATERAVQAGITALMMTAWAARVPVDARPETAEARV